MVEDSPLDLAFELTEPTAIHNLELLMASNVECLGVYFRVTSLTLKLI